MSDEAFHEIQLNGKQLVFLFMAATVVAVVIFLCGVMVGRGVPTRAASAIDAPGQASFDPTAAVQAQAVASTGNGPVTAQETLTYPALLEDPNPPVETLAPPRAAAPPPVVVPRPAAASAPPAVTATAEVPLSEPTGNGFVVQVAAVRQLVDANTIARRLSTKGYPSFVTTAGANFRVRVGKYSDRREAELVAGRLEKEERFKVWITR